MYLIFSTAPVDHAANLAKTLIAQRVAACVNILPHVESVYEWGGDLCQERESLLLIKTSEEAVDQCVEGLRVAHPYEVPEIISLKVDEATSLPSYLQWVISSTTPR